LFSVIRRPPTLPLFPSTTLFRSASEGLFLGGHFLRRLDATSLPGLHSGVPGNGHRRDEADQGQGGEDRDGLTPQVDRRVESDRNDQDVADDVEGDDAIERTGSLLHPDDGEDRPDGDHARGDQAHGPHRLISACSSSSSEAIARITLSSVASTPCFIASIPPWKSTSMKWTWSMPLDRIASTTTEP